MSGNCSLSSVKLSRVAPMVRRKVTYIAVPPVFPVSIPYIREDEEIERLTME